MRARWKLLSVTALAALTACKSLPMGSFKLMNSPAMQVAKLVPPIEVASADQQRFAADQRLVGMAISGGGMRASAFALGVFAGLQEIKDQSGRSAMDMVDFASSNSGGSWALAALLTDRRSDARFVPTNDYESYARRFAQLNSSSTKNWASAMQHTLGVDIKMADIRDVRPAAYFNATLLPSQDPFVFTQSFADKYQIANFYARGQTTAFGSGGSVDTLPVGYVAATSGSVPGFTHSYVETSWCTGQPRPSFCRPDGDGGWFRVVDGGLYDNLAYKTAWEVARATVASSAPPSRAMILIDSKNGWPLPTLEGSKARSHDGLLRSGLQILPQGSFPMQESTFRRLADDMFNTLNYQTVLLDFDAASDFSEEQQTRRDDLPDLFRTAADKIDCITDDGVVLRAKDRTSQSVEAAIAVLKSRGGDCLANNLARVGYYHKTTYFYDPDFFAATYQLGVYVARRRAADIRTALGIK